MAEPNCFSTQDLRDFAGPAMINVLHLTSSFGLSGGAETNLLRLVCHMDRSRFRNTVVTMTDLIPSEGSGSAAIAARQGGIPVYSLGMRRGVPSPLAAARFFRIVRKVRPDILQTWMYHADLLGLLVGKLAGVSSIAWNIRCSSMDMDALPPNVERGTARVGVCFIVSACRPREFPPWHRGSQRTWV